MNYIFLFRGAAADDAIIWLMLIMVTLLMLGGRRFVQWLSAYIHHRRMQHMWPFR